MSAPLPLEAHLLKRAERFARDFSQRLGSEKMFEARLQLLEAASSCVGGFSLREYFAAFDIHPLEDLDALADAARKLLSLISDTPIHPSLALSSLAREPVPESDRKSTGTYYTDF
ncbi:hypothetical protein BRCH_01707c [Candidatus Burkholderia brachyanthoides]|nr:hypothetical protein BRCH_01707c [Candidatus Burkholderia brachyanthoides]